MSDSSNFLGLISDVQYADVDNGTSYDGTETRFFRATLESCRKACKFWKELGASDAIHLGDLIDGRINPARLHGHQPSKDAFDVVMESLQAAGARIHHVVGNHDLYNFDRSEISHLMTLPRGVHLADPSDAYYYHFSPCTGWRCIVLDAFDVAVHDGRIAGSPQSSAACDMIRAHNPNPSASDKSLCGDYHLGMTPGPLFHFMPYNGGVGGKQLLWLRQSLQSAFDALERVIVFSHVAIGDVDREIRVLNSASRARIGRNTVAAVVSGHYHSGSYACDSEGVHHLVVESPLIRSNGAWGALQLLPDRIEVLGRGEMQSRTLIIRKDGASTASS